MTQTDIRHLRKSLRMVHGAQIDSWTDWKVRDFVDRSKRSLEIRRTITLGRLQQRFPEVFKETPSADENRRCFEAVARFKAVAFGMPESLIVFDVHVDYADELARYKHRYPEFFYG